MDTFNLRINNCINILHDLLIINSEKAEELRKRVAVDDRAAYVEILGYLEKLKELKDY